MNKQNVPGLLLCLLAWLLAGQPAQAQGGHWTFDDVNNPFEDFMTINGYIVLDGTEVESNRFEIAAFIGGECRGTYTLEAQTWSGHNYPCFLPVWGKTSETGQAVTVKVYDHSTGTEYEAYEKPLYEYNGNLGGFDDDGNAAPLYRFTIASDPNTLVYNLSIIASQNGSVSADVTSGLPGTVITLTLTPAAGYEPDAVSAYKTNESATTVSLSGTGNTRTFVMPAYPVTVSAVFGKTQATLDAEAIATAVSLIENAAYSFLQSGGNTEEDIIRQLVAQINDLLSGTGITVTADDITLSNFTPATAGSAGSPGGTDGGFSFSVNLHKNSTSQTTGGISGVIAATRYTAIGDISQEKGLKASVQNGTLYAGGLTQDKAWSVYNLSGALVYGGIAGGDKAEVHLQNRGVYIVKSGKDMIKVVY